MEIEVKKIKNTPIKLVHFKGEVVGCFYYGDTYIPKEAFSEEVR